MKKKKVLFLGGSKFQIPPLVYAKKKGYEVITCDYLPDNPGHKYADKYYNVSTTDYNAVLDIALREKVDGVVAYASDPAAPTQAYVANKLGLPSNPYESVKILSRKDLFRNFLSENNFSTPKSKSFYSLDGVNDWLKKIGFPVMIKPVDSSGSKGVSKVYQYEQVVNAFDFAMGFSREKKIVIEEYFSRDGYQVCGDGFVVNGELVFTCFGNGHADKLCNIFAPTGESFPAIIDQRKSSKAHSETSRLLNILGIRNGALNFDFHYNKDGEFSFLELGPRNGGNLIPEVIKYSTGVDLVKYTVESAIGNDCSMLRMKEPNGYYAAHMIHSTEDGVIVSFFYSDEIQDNIIEKTLYNKIGDTVRKFNSSADTIGTMILKFSSEEEMLYKMDNMGEFVRVLTV